MMQHARIGDGRAFVGARRLLLKYGTAVVKRAIRDTTVRLMDLAVPVEGGEDPPYRRHWRSEIVSPAQYVNWYCGELIGEIRPARRRRRDED